MPRDNTVLLALHNGLQESYFMDKMQLEIYFSIKQEGPIWTLIIWAHQNSSDIRSWEYYFRCGGSIWLMLSSHTLTAHATS